MAEEWRDGDNWFRLSRVEEDTIDFDIAFWQAQGPEAILREAWEMVVRAHLAQGGSVDELRLDRSIVVFGPGPGAISDRGGPCSDGSRLSEDDSGPGHCLILSG